MNIQNTAKTKKCPFCSEEILVDARKCKHCAEWLDKSAGKNNLIDEGSVAAKAVAKGIKKKEMDETGMQCLGIIALIFSVTIGVMVLPMLGIVVFVVLMIFIARSYYKE